MGMSCQDKYLIIYIYSRGSRHHYTIKFTIKYLKIKVIEGDSFIKKISLKSKPKKKINRHEIQKLYSKKWLRR